MTPAIILFGPTAFILFAPALTNRVHIIARSAVKRMTLLARLLQTTEFRGRMVTHRRIGRAHSAEAVGYRHWRYLPHVLPAMLLVCVFFGPAIAGQMALPSLPSLSVAEKSYDYYDYDVDVADPEDILDLNNLDAVGRAAGFQKGPGAPAPEAVRDNAKKIDYTGKARRTSDRGRDADEVCGREGPQEADEEASPRTGLLGLSADRGLGFDERAPGFGQIGFAW